MGTNPYDNIEKKCAWHSEQQLTGKKDVNNSHHKSPHEKSFRSCDFYRVKTVFVPVTFSE